MPGTIPWPGYFCASSLRQPSDFWKPLFGRWPKSYAARIEDFSIPPLQSHVASLPAVMPWSICLARTGTSPDV